MTIVWAGLSVGAMYALVAIGYNITFLLAGLLNFAHAMFIVAGAFVTYWATIEMGLPGALALVLATGVGTLLGLAEERVAARPLTRNSNGSESHNELVTTVGTALFLTGVLIVIWGPDPLRVPFIGPSVRFTLFGGRIAPVELLLIVVAVLSGSALHVWSKKTKMGLAGLARTEDAEAAALRGVNVRRLSLVGFIVAGAFGGMLGLLVGPKAFAFAFLGTTLAIKGFVVLILGGVGSHKGAVIGGLIVGLLESMTARWIGGDFANLVVFFLFLAVLLLLPEGLFGGRVSRAV